MIIRRKHTANFTTIGNALFNDERLEADEVGILAYLLSRPNDWEVRRTQLAKRFKMGREAIRRVLRNLIRFGWVVSRATRLSNGTVHVIYEVRDEPGPELSADEARAALSLTSSGAGSGETAGDPTDDDAGPETDADPGGGEGVESTPPVTGQPYTADRPTAGRNRPIEDSLNTDSVKPDSTNVVWTFADVKGKWPKEHVLSVFAAEQAFVSLTEAMQDACHNGVAPYLDDCKANSRKVCDLTTFIRERRWERFQKIKSAGQITSIKAHTPEFHRWREYYSETEDTGALSALELMAKLGRDITVPSRWPPALPKPEPPKESSAA